MSQSNFLVVGVSTLAYINNLQKRREIESVLIEESTSATIKYCSSPAYAVWQQASVCRGTPKLVALLSTILSLLICFWRNGKTVVAFTSRLIARVALCLSINFIQLCITKTVAKRMQSLSVLPSGKVKVKANATQFKSLT